MTIELDFGRLVHQKIGEESQSSVVEVLEDFNRKLLHFSYFSKNLEL